jgi:hypothetical protein
MALKRITMTRVPASTDPVPNRPFPGVADLPEAILFDGTENPAWQPFSLSPDGTFADLAKYDNGWLVANVPGHWSWGRVGLLSAAPMLKFDARIERTPYRLRIKVDPERTDGFAAIFSSAKVEDMWESRAALVEVVKQTKGRNLGKYKFTLNQGYYGDWTRYIDPAWMSANWDGAIEIEFGRGWMRASLPGGPSIRGTSISSGFGTAWHMVMQSIGSADDQPGKLALGRVTGGWVTPMMMSEQERMLLLDDADFDVDAYIDLLGAELTERLP